MIFGKEARELFMEIANLHLLLVRLATKVGQINRRLSELEEKVRYVNSRTY